MAKASGPVIASVRAPETDTDPRRLTTGNVVGANAPNNVGSGLHVYWTLTHAISPAEWHPMAAALEKALVQHGIHHDPQSDHGFSARVATAVHVEL